MLGALALPLPPLGSLQGEGVVQGEGKVLGVRHPPKGEQGGLYPDELLVHELPLSPLSAAGGAFGCRSPLVFRYAF